MSSQGLAFAVAVVGGILLAAVLFVPVAAVHYRRHGSLTGRDLAALLATAVYGTALWTYTLLPLPPDDDFACRQPITRVRTLLDGVRAHPHDGLLDLARNPMVLQVVLNVALFVPLGVLLRLRRGRGVVVAGAVGLAISLSIELTQYTGLWGIYHCAYRYFDIGDLIANPLGSVVGSVLAAIVVGRRPEERRAVAPRLTTGRRLVALTSDLLVMVIVGSVVVGAWRAWLLVGRQIGPGAIDPRVQTLLQWGVPLGLQAVAVLGWGRTIGEAVVQVRTRAPNPGWTVPARLVKLATGVGALAVVGAWDQRGAGWALVALVLVNIGAAAVTHDGRGLSNQLAGLEVELARSGPTAGSGPADGGPTSA